MNKKDEALNLALEALIYCEALNSNVERQKIQAITAIKEALAQPDTSKFGSPQMHELILAKLAQSKHKPLTDEQIEEIVDDYLVDYRIPAGCAWNFARAIEAAHGIKENT